MLSFKKIDLVSYPAWAEGLVNMVGTMTAIYLDVYIYWFI